MKMKFLIVCSVILCVFMLETKAKMIGGLQDVDTNDANLVPIIEFTETMLNRGVNSIYSHKIGKILKAQKQLVAGDKFYLTFEFNRTNSPKGQPISKNYEITKTEICSAEVWSRPWLTTTDKLQLLTFKCNPAN